MKLPFMKPGFTVKLVDEAGLHGEAVDEAGLHGEATHETGLCEAVRS